MLDRIRRLFGSEGGGAKTTKDDAESLQSRYDDLKRLHDRLLDEYESLSRKYFALKVGNDKKCPNVKDEFAPKCVRKQQETCSYFRMHSSDYIPAFKKFLRRSGHWTLDCEPDVQRGETAESCEPVAWFINEKSRRVEIPYGCVFIVFDEAPRTEWLVITEERFEKDWLPI